VSERTQTVRQNYLNNRDLLLEIHRSKNSYCSFKDAKTDSDYDIILKGVDEITVKNTRKAKKNRLERLNKQLYEQQLLADPTVKPDKNQLKLKDISDEDIVFRVMTQEHVPIDQIKTASMLDNDDCHTEYDNTVDAISYYIKVNFPSFQHYRLDKNGIPKCVGKSHWRGDIKKGEFSKDHGQITNKLAMMFMKLCERYATRSNWRGYTYVDEMRSQALLQLSQVGLQFDESKSNNPFSYYTAVITNSFTRVLNIEKRNQNIRDDIMEMNDLNPSYTRQFQNLGDE
jgi:hypothetical protein